VSSDSGNSADPSSRLAMTGYSDARTLDRALIHGLAWTGGVKWASQVFSWAATLLVARLLSPEDYGLVGMAGVYLAFVWLISEFGIGASVVTLRALPSGHIAQLNSLAVLLGFFGFALSCAAAQPIALFFEAPDLNAVVIAMSVTFAVTGLRTVPQAMLQRDLRFKRLAFIDGVQALVVAVASIGFAVAGFRYWALVISILLSVLLSTVLTILSSPQPFALPRLRVLRPSLEFGGHVILQRLAYFTYSNADFLIAGKLLGTAALGAYSFALGLANLPMEKVAALVSQVTPTIFATAQVDRAALRRYFLALTEGVALISFPMTLGLALVAEDLVPLALGEKWTEMIPPLTLLALYASVRSISTLLPPILNVTGDASFVARISILAALVLPVGFYLGSRWGTTGLAAASMVGFPVMFLPLYRRVAARIEFGATDYFRALWPALSASLLMAVAVLLLKWTLAKEIPEGIRFAAQVTSGAAVYSFVVFTLHRGRLRAFIRSMRAQPLA
jgi:O-antigen/teichoic acid export membrane protein